MGRAVNGRWSGLLKVCRRVALFFAVVYLLVCAGCAAFQRRLIYFPPVMSAAAVEQAGTEAQLERWVGPARQAFGWKRTCQGRSARGKVLVVHGNGGCAFQCGHYADVVQQAAPLDVFLLEYPGYADRPGKPSEHSLDTAADQAFEALAADGPVYVAGESLGTGVAAHLAGKYPNKVAGLVLLAPYDSLTAVGQAHMPLLPVSLLLLDRFPAAKDLRDYHGPVAVLVGGQDAVVPERFGRRLYDGYAGPKRLWEVPGATHSSLMFEPPAFWEPVVAFWHTHS